MADVELVVDERMPVRFVTPFEQHADRSGQRCIIVRPLLADEVDEEVGSMFRVRFDDGAEIDAFEDELR